MAIVRHKLLGENNIKEEWNVAKDSMNDFTRELYCPRLDIAVGPFNIDRNISYNNMQYARKYSKCLDSWLY